jgi:hypothetical protein
MKERTAPKRQPRPVYYTRDQLDEQCEQIIVGFCMARYGQELNPIPTEALPAVARRVHPRRRSNGRPAGRHQRGDGVLLGPQANRED